MGSKFLNGVQLKVPRAVPTRDELAEWHGRAEALVEEAFRDFEHLDVADPFPHFQEDYHENLRAARRENDSAV